jgi:arginase family enzyme
VKSGALLLIVSGDGSIALATVAGARRYYRNVSMVYMSRNAGLRTPATTSTGSVEEMVASHLTGRGAAELVRFWGEPPLVREPDFALFGVDRFDPVEDAVLGQSPIRRYLADEVQRTGASAAAKIAIDRIRGNGNPFILHLHVDVIPDFQATDAPGAGGLRLEEIREALAVFARQEHLIAIEVVGYNPAKDSDASGAQLIMDLLVGALRARSEALPIAAAPTTGEAEQSANAVTTPAPAATPIDVVSASSSPEQSATIAVPDARPGETWSSEPTTAEAEGDRTDADDSESSGQTDESDS